MIKPCDILTKDKIRRVVLKVGSNLMTEAGLASDTKVKSVVEEIVYLKSQVHDVVVVSSGAIAAGSGHLGKKTRPSTIPLKQAAASIGQPIIMAKYAQFLEPYNKYVGQILLTQGILNEIDRYLNARNTIDTLLHHDMIPIVNENDTVAVDEIKFGDNDTLAAMVALMVDADLLILLSDVNGLYKHFGTEQQTLIPVVPDISREILDLAASKSQTGSTYSIGGIQTKINAARIVTNNGIPCILANGTKKQILKSIWTGQEEFTIFLATQKKMTARKKWLLWHSKVMGSIQIDEGAKNALLHQGKSLLPIGVRDVKGSFQMFDTVAVVDEKESPIARGLVNYSSKELQIIKGKQSAFIDMLLGFNSGEEVIHRDNMALL